MSSRWKDNASVYPSAGEIAAALQDQGKVVVVKRKGGNLNKHRYPLIEKLASKVYAKIRQEFAPDGLTKNVSRGKTPLYKEILLSRRHVDVTETDPFFLEYTQDGKVFLINNSPVHCGLDHSIDHFQDFVLQQTQQKNSARTNNDGLRLGCILLDANHRGSVSGMMSKKKNRNKSDITGDPITHFFEEILTEYFLNKGYVAPMPSDGHYSEFPEEEKGSWEPNHPSLFEQDRSAIWLRGTWDDYIRPKYKKALDKWNKDTGGGDGTPTSFVDYCGSDRWLVWLFCIDLEANFLLACSAGGRMPKNMQVESGFGEDLSSLDDTSGSGARLSGSGAAKRVIDLENDLLETRKQRQKINDTMEKVASFVKAKSTATVSDSTSVDTYIHQVTSYSQMMRDTQVLDTMSPESKNTYLATLQMQRKQLLQKMSASTVPPAAASAASDDSDSD
jgi:hypothetical protein